MRHEDPVGLDHSQDGVAARIERIRTLTMNKGRAPSRPLGCRRDRRGGSLSRNSQRRPFHATVTLSQLHAVMAFRRAAICKVLAAATLPARPRTQRSEQFATGLSRREAMTTPVPGPVALARRHAPRRRSGAGRFHRDARHALRRAGRRRLVSRRHQDPLSRDHHRLLSTGATFRSQPVLGRPPAVFLACHPQSAARGGFFLFKSGKQCEAVGT